MARIQIELDTDNQEDRRMMTTLGLALAVPGADAATSWASFGAPKDAEEILRTSPFPPPKAEKPAPEPAPAPAEVAPAAAKAEPAAPTTLNSKPVEMVVIDEAPSAASMTLDDVRAVMRETLRLTGPNPVQAVFRKAKIEQVSDLKPAMFASFVADLVAARTAAGGAK